MTSPGFDVAALCALVHACEVGYEVETNNPEGFKRLVYAYGRSNPAHAVRIFVAPGSDPNRLWLLRPDAEPPVAQGGGEEGDV